MRLKYCTLLLMVSVFVGLGHAQTASIDFGIEMVFVDGGEFMMGCTPEQWNDCEENEKPAHQVRVSSFEIGRTEVTQAQWQAVMEGYQPYWDGDDLPVVSACWGGPDCPKESSVEEFIRRLNEMTGKNYRLPTEAEWEYAARGGNRSKGYKYSGSDTVDEVAWHNGNSGGITHEACAKKPNELGLCDMSGNVSEWVQDWYGTYSGAVQTDPAGPQSGAYRVLRDSDWINGTKTMRVSFRHHNAPEIRTRSIGFRLARSR